MTSQRTSTTVQSGDSLTIQGKNYNIVRKFNSGSEAEIYEVSCNGRTYGLKLYRKGFKPNMAISGMLDGLKGMGYTVETISAGKTAYNGTTYDYELMDWYPLGSANSAGLKGNSEAILAITIKTALALDAFHKAGFVHKDIKPANILIKDRGTWDTVICDFGIADVLSNGTAVTKQLRTPIYAAPEIYDPKKAKAIVDGENLFTISGKADYYSLGMTILSLWYGESEFQMKETDMSITKLTTGIAVPLDMPDPLATIARGLLLKNPLKRWDLEEIQNFLNGGDFSVKEEDIFEDLNIVYNAGKNQIANTVQQLAAFMLEDLELAKKYLYKGKLRDWLKSRPEIQTELEDIVEKRYPKDMDLGVMAAIYVLDPNFGFFMSGWNRKTGEEVVISAHDSGEVVKFCNENFCDTGTKEMIVSDLFTEWLRNEYVDEVWRIESIVPKKTNDEDEYVKELELAFRLRIQTLDPLCDICLCSDVNDPFYTMTGESIGRLLNIGYQAIFVDYRDDSTELIDKWSGPEYAPYNTYIDVPGLVYLLDLEDYEESYLHRFFQTKGSRFKAQDATLQNEIENWHEPDENKLRAGDDDDNYLIAIMRIISSFGHTPTYRFAGTDIEVSKLSEFKRYLGRKDMMQKALYEQNLIGWLSIQYHENPHADFTAKYSYEKALIEYTKCIGAINPEDADYENYKYAADEARSLVSDARNSFGFTRLRDMSQKVVAALFGLIPLVLLTMKIIGAIIKDPIGSSNIEFAAIFYSLGIITAIVVFFKGETESCIACLIAGGIVSGVVWLVLSFLSPFLIWIYLLMVLAAIGYFGFIIFFVNRGQNQVARPDFNPGFEELELEPIHYAYSDEETFDSSLNGMYDEDDIEDWKEDLKIRRKTILLFIGCSFVLHIFSAFLPIDDSADKNKDKAETEVVVSDSEE